LALRRIADDDEIQEYIAALQDFLSQDEPEDNADNEESGNSDDQEASSYSYARELARANTRLEIRKIRQDDQEDTIIKFTSIISDLQKRLIKLEAQPLPVKDAIRAIAKMDDYMVIPKKATEKSQADSTLELIKIALANPVTI
jgi:hypothetical protein